MEFTQAQSEGADEAAAPPSGPWHLHDFDTLLDNNLFDVSYDTPRLDEPLDPSRAAFDTGDIAHPETNVRGIGMTDTCTFPSPLAHPSCAAYDVGDKAAFPQYYSGEPPRNFVITDQMISDFLSGPETSQAHIPDLPLSASDNKESHFTSDSAVIQSSGPLNWTDTSHQGQNPLHYPPAPPPSQLPVVNRAVNSSFQLGTYTAPFSQSQPAKTVQTALQSFDGPRPLATLHPPNSSPTGPATTILPMPQLEPSSATQAIRTSQPQFRLAPFRPLAPKRTSPNSSTLAIQGPLPPPALQITGQSSNSKLKRRLSIHEAFGQVCFWLDPSAELARKSKKRPKKYSEHVCLRCQVQNKQVRKFSPILWDDASLTRLKCWRCSGTFPCERCLALWENRKNKHTKATLAFQTCFDCDVREFDSFYALWVRFYVPGMTGDICQGDKISTPDWTAFGCDLLKSVDLVCSSLEQVVAHTMVDAGLAQFDAVPLLRGLLDDGGNIPPQRLPAITIHYNQPPSYWIMAVLHFHPEVIAIFIEASHLTMWTLRASLSKIVFERVNYLIREFKSKPSSTTSKDREELIFSLITIKSVQRSKGFLNNSLGFIALYIFPEADRKGIALDFDPKGPNQKSIPICFPINAATWSHWHPTGSNDCTSIYPPLPRKITLYICSVWQYYLASTFHKNGRWHHIPLTRRSSLPSSTKPNS